MPAKPTPVTRYFNAIDDALNGLDTYLREEDSPLYQHDLVGAVVAGYLKRMRGSFESWQHRLIANKWRNQFFTVSNNIFISIRRRVLMSLRNWNPAR